MRRIFLRGHVSRYWPRLMGSGKTRLISMRNITMRVRVNALAGVAEDGILVETISFTLVR